VHHLIHQLFVLVRHAAQAHPYWCLPIAAVIAFSESFVGISLIVPGTILLITLGSVIGASHIPLWLDRRGLDFLVDWHSLPPSDSAYLAIQPVRGPDRKRPAFFPSLGHPGNLHRSLPGSPAGYGAAGVGHVGTRILALHDRQQHLGRDLGLCAACLPGLCHPLLCDLTR
jgi:hypothetical protein